MEKKYTVTVAEIENDLATAFENPPDPPKPKAKYNIYPYMIAIVAMVPLSVLFFYAPWWTLLALVMIPIVLVVCALIHELVLKIRAKTVSCDDYVVTQEVVHSISEEHYHIRRRGSISSEIKYVNNYNIRFENKKIWRIPKQNYGWREEGFMGPEEIYKATHRDDTFTVITDKRSKRITVAYNNKYFNYKTQ